MDILPASVEAYLVEAGFADTEILILKRLLEDPMTIRELSAKFGGKSTGGLDSAMKKLVRKRFVRREIINGSEKYTITSLQSIVDWLERNMKEKHATLQRRQQDFESFIKTVSLDKTRPEMRHYHGDEGLQKAYMDLLDLGGKEILMYLSVTTTAEADPLRELKVSLFRERRKRGIFSRVIAHDTPLGRRFQSRDPFEYRETKLVPEKQLPFTFEKAITGDTVACLNHVEKKACIMYYPELAANESMLFESLWRQKFSGEGVITAAAASPPPPPIIPLSTRTLSSLRSFFLSRRSVAILIGLGLLSGFLTYGLYRQSAALNFRRMQDQVRSIASTAVFQFDPKDIEELRVEEDWKKPEWARVVNQMKQIRLNNDNIFFVYMFRKSGTDPNTLTFVADSHSINPYANTDDDPTNNVDVNGNGIMDAVDVLQWPGQVYPDPPEEAFLAFNGPLANNNFYTDSWGTYVSGYAPIRDGEGNSIAVLAVDIQAEKLSDLTRETFTPLISFLAIFLVFVCIRLAAFNRSLFKEVWEGLQMKKVLSTFALAGVLSGVLTYSLYAYSYSLNLQKIREKALSIAATGALQFHASDLLPLQTREDVRKPEYAKVIQTLNDIRNQNPSVRYIYIMRPTSDENTLEFVADADSLDPAAKKDLNGDGKIDDKDWLSPPGEPYDISAIPAYTEAIREGVTTADQEPYTDQWGTFISGHAPIKDDHGAVIAVLGVDIFANQIRESTQASFKPFLLFLTFFLLFVLTRLLVFNRPSLKTIWKVFNLRRALASFAFCAMLAFGITYGMYRYTLGLMQEEIGNRLMSIAATAASQIDAKDLEPLRFARDMRREEYQRVFRTLNEVRGENSDIKWIYVFRKTDTEGVLEFVVDGDANYNLPASHVFTDDGKVTEDEENVAPGLAYVPNKGTKMFEGFEHPAADHLFYTDQWGTYISGYAPIRDEKGNSVAIIGLDMDISKIYLLMKRKFAYWLWFTGTLSSLAIFAFLLRISGKIAHPRPPKISSN